jgi:mRNA interferase MazF
VERGEIWWANLPAPTGSEPGYRRPVLIVQSDVFNQTHIRTVLVAAITSNLKLGDAPGNVVLATRSSGLLHDSVVNVSQVLAVDKAFLVEPVHTLSARIMAQVDAGLRLVLAL